MEYKISWEYRSSEHPRIRTSLVEEGGYERHQNIHECDAMGGGVLEQALDQTLFEKL